MKEHKPKDMPNNVDNLVITCIDHRFQRAIRERLQADYQVDIESSDRLAYAGASKAVADGTLIPQIQLSHELHDIKNVYVVDHTDCGGFGGLKAHDEDESKEIASHMESITRAQEAVHKVLPHLVVTSFVVNLEGLAVPFGVVD